MQVSLERQINLIKCHGEGHKVKSYGISLEEAFLGIVPYPTATSFTCSAKLAALETLLWEVTDYLFVKHGGA